jgi:hypothetical protein
VGFAQPASNQNQTLIPKRNAQDKLLVVVVYRGFSATTTKKKQKFNLPINKEKEVS